MVFPFRIEPMVILIAQPLIAETPEVRPDMSLGSPSRVPTA